MLRYYKFLVTYCIPKTCMLIKTFLLYFRQSETRRVRVRSASRSDRNRAVVGACETKHCDRTRCVGCRTDFFFFRTVAACETVLREESHSSSVISVVFRSVLRFGSVSVVSFRGGRSL